MIEVDVIALLFVRGGWLPIIVGFSPDTPNLFLSRDKVQGLLYMFVGYCPQGVRQGSGARGKEEEESVEEVKNVPTAGDELNTRQLEII